MFTVIVNVIITVCLLAAVNERVEEHTILDTVFLFFITAVFFLSTSLNYLIRILISYKYIVKTLTGISQFICCRHVKVIPFILNICVFIHSIT